MMTSGGENTTSTSRPPRFKPTLPPEILWDIFQLATKLLTYFDLTSNPHDWPASVCPDLDEYRASLKTKTALKLTSRCFSDIADESLFDVIVLYQFSDRGARSIRLLGDELARRFAAPQVTPQNLRTTQLFVLRREDNEFFQPLTSAITWIIRHSKSLTCFGWLDTSNPFDYHDPHRNAIFDSLPETIQFGNWNGYILSSALFGVVYRSRKSLRAVRVREVIWDGVESKRVSLPHLTPRHKKYFTSNRNSQNLEDAFGDPFGFPPLFH